MAGKKHTALETTALLQSMQERFHILEPEFLSHDRSTIYRVPPNVRGEDGAAYDPTFISIGPFHHGKPELEQMEKLKWRYLHDLLNRSSKNKMENYINSIASIQDRVRKQYYGEIRLSSEAFLEMLVIDGCFLLEFFLKRAFGKIEGELTAVKWNLPMLRRDMLLLENQIPFFVLEELHDRTYYCLPGSTSDDQKTLTFLNLALHYISRGKVKPADLPEGLQVCHLLHLAHICLMLGHVPDTPKDYSCLQLVHRKVKASVSLVLITSIYFLVSLMLKCKRPSPSSDKKGSRFPRMIPSTRELLEAGVQFKKKKGDCFLNVSFRDGVIKIPHLSIQENTNSYFRNLIAFEQCCSSIAGNNFTSFAVFMDNIVDTADDVAMLEDAGIVESKLGNDEEVARLFNRLCKGACLDYQGHYLTKLFKDVREYCESDRHKWRAKLVREYFSNPWAVISLVAAAFLLLLTATQTVFAILSYVRPPRNN